MSTLHTADGAWLRASSLSEPLAKLIIVEILDSIIEAAAWVCSARGHWKRNHWTGKTKVLRDIWVSELRGDKKSSPSPPRTQCFVPITAATAVILLKLTPIRRVYRGNQCKFLNSYRRYRVKRENPFPITAVFTAVIAVFTAVIALLPRSVIPCMSLIWVTKRTKYARITNGVAFVGSTVVWISVSLHFYAPIYSMGIFPIYIFNTIFVSSHMYPENPEGTQVIVGSMIRDIYPTLPGIELTTWLFRPGSRYH